MSFKKTLFRSPATLLGILLGLVAGLLAIAKELFDKDFPKLGLAIMFITPLVTFAFEKVMSRAFPNGYWEKVGGKLLKAYRYIINEDFRLKFTYQIKFSAPADTLPKLDPELIIETVKAVHGGEPEPQHSGSNFIHLGFKEPPFLVRLSWHLEPVTNPDELPIASFAIRLQPEIRDVVMRKARNDIDGMVTRINRLKDDLILLFKVRPETLAFADAWLGETLPEALPLRRVRNDATSGAEYRVFPGRMHVAGLEPSALGAVYRFVATLEEPPDPEQEE